MKSFTFAVVILVGVVTQVYSGCINCGFGPGRDVCTNKGGQPGSCTPMIVRPNKLPRIDITELCKPKVVVKEIHTGFKPLRPIADLCSSTRAIVTPAFVPKPACALCGTSSCGCSSSSSSSSTSSSSHSSSGASFSSHGGDSFLVSSGGSDAASGRYVQETSSGSLGSSSGCGGSVYQGEYGSYAPADAVSLSLAYKLQNELNNIAEDKLFFGFHKLPREIQVAKKVKNVIAEENLYSHNGQVVELKPVIIGNSKTIDEEAEEALLDEELIQDVEEEMGGNGVKKLTYDEIGFGPARVKSTPYIEVKGTGVEMTAQATSASSGNACADGYIPGKVIVNAGRNIENNYDEDDYQQGGVSYPSFSYSSSSSSASSSSSSSRHHSAGGHKIIFETLDSCDD